MLNKKKTLLLAMINGTFGDNWPAMINGTFGDNWPAMINGTFGDNWPCIYSDW